MDNVDGLGAEIFPGAVVPVKNKVSTEAVGGIRPLSTAPPHLRGHRESGARTSGEELAEEPL